MKEIACALFEVNLNIYRTKKLMTFTICYNLFMLKQLGDKAIRKIYLQLNALRTATEQLIHRIINLRLIDHFFKNKCNLFINMLFFILKIVIRQTMENCCFNTTD